MAKEGKKRLLRPVQDEKRLYFVLQLILAVLQILLFYVFVMEQNMKQFGVLFFALIGIGLMLLAGKGWQNRGARIFGIVAMLLLFVGFAAVVVLDVITFRISDVTGTVARDFNSYSGQLMANTALYIQPLVLVFFPTLAIGARRVGNPTDIRLLRVVSFLAALTAAITLSLSLESGTTVLAFKDQFLLGLSAKVMLIVYLISTLASVFTVFLLYPPKAFKRPGQKEKAQ